jgi:cytochrome oxidase Cu insertion factor (SCO1/SenC/PrrC family)/acyl-CoA thioesterase FadM
LRDYIAAMLRRSHVVGLSVLAVAAAILVAYFAFPAVFERPRVIVSGIADVGGPFTLTAHTGERVSDDAFRGQFMLVAFGFTHCPDVCPAELQVMTAALESMGPEADRVQPLFITIDPERDTAEHLADYMAHFHPRLIGLTGSPDEIANVAKAYHVWYEKVQGRRVRLRHGPHQHHVPHGPRRRIRAALQLRHQRRHPRQGPAKRRDLMIETYRSIVHPWECDSVDHFTTAYYFAAFGSAEWNLLQRLGLDAGGIAALEPRSCRTRFMHELRAGSAYHIVSGVLDAGPGTARLGHQLFNSETDALSATHLQDYSGKIALRRSPSSGPTRSRSRRSTSTASTNGRPPRPTSSTPATSTIPAA